MNKIDLSIIIVSYNVKELLINCINSIYSAIPQTINAEIIVVDNNSSDKSVEYIKEHFKTVSLIDNKFNAGFALGNNQGMQIAKGEVFFLLNPDTEVYPGAIEVLYKYITSNKHCSIVAPQLILADDSIQPSAWKNHSYLDMVYETFFISKFYNRLNYRPEDYIKQMEVKTLSGAALIFRKELVEKIGDLDVQFFWMEDIDFCYRAQKIGKLVYLPSAKVRHFSGSSQKSNQKAAISNQIISKLKYYRKHNGLFKEIIAIFTCFIFIVSRILALSLLFPFKKQYREKMNCYIYSLKCFFSYLVFGNKKIVGV
jgi:hypothetical protein